MTPGIPEPTPEPLLEDEAQTAVDKIREYGEGPPEADPWIDRTERMVGELRELRRRLADTEERLPTWEWASPEQKSYLLREVNAALARVAELEGRLADTENDIEYLLISILHVRTNGLPFPPSIVERTDALREVLAAGVEPGLKGGFSSPVAPREETPRRGGMRYPDPEDAQEEMP